MVLALILDRSVLERRASVKHLEAMDDRELADLGISRSEISAAVGGSCRPPDLFAFSRFGTRFQGAGGRSAEPATWRSSLGRRYP